MMKKIRMGMIGLGSISGFHIEGIQRSPDAELTALCDTDTMALQRNAERYGVPSTHCFTNYQELLACSDVDAVSICTPNNTHFSIVEEAIRRKKPFALEKPVALHANEAQILKELAEEAGVPNMVCFSYRFKGAARYARWLIRNGHLGSIRHVYVQYLQSWAASGELPLIWRFRKEITGSGAHGDLGSHMLDLTRFLVGDFVKVCAQAGTFISRRKMSDSEESGTVDVDDYCNYKGQLSENRGLWQQGRPGVLPG